MGQGSIDHLAVCQTIKDKTVIQSYNGVVTRNKLPTKRLVSPTIVAAYCYQAIPIAHQYLLPIIGIDVIYTDISSQFWQTIKATYRLATRLKTYINH
ncbi:hypothetical protein A9308_08180 [Moraxella atlantae]|uniref:Uncharacterized protein n=1 Tax=Faucicola atlantae TaxID=34059 RepID=A0A1B8QAZ5_9GAMM|nr:hypothetical protein A9308_08180 [Moraxella atlantae]